MQMSPRDVYETAADGEGKMYLQPLSTLFSMDSPIGEQVIGGPDPADSESPVSEGGGQQALFR